MAFILGAVGVQGLSKFEWEQDQPATMGGSTEVATMVQVTADSGSPRTGALGLQASRQNQGTDCKIHQTWDSLDVEGEVEGGVGDDCQASVL